MGDVGVAGGVDHHPTEHCVTPGLRLNDHADDRVVLDDRGDDHGVQQRLDPRFGDHVVGDVLEPLGVERVAVALGFGLGCAGRLRSLLELDADAFGILGLFVAIPGEAFDPDLGDVAAEAAVAFEEKHRHPGAGGTDCSGEATRSGADHEDVGGASTSRVRAGSVITPSMGEAVMCGRAYRGRGRRSMVSRRASWCATPRPRVRRPASVWWCSRLGGEQRFDDDIVVWHDEEREGVALVPAAVHDPMRRGDVFASRPQFEHLADVHDERVGWCIGVIHSPSRDRTSRPGTSPGCSRVMTFVSLWG